MITKKLSEMLESRYNYFGTENSLVEVKINEEETRLSQDSIEVAIDLFKNIDGKGKSEITLKLCKIPMRIGNDLFSVDKTHYRLVNGLIQKDGFYLERNNKDKVILKFIKMDKPLFTIKLNKDNELVVVFAKNSKAEPMSIMEFLLGLNIIKNPEECDLIFYKYKEFISTERSLLSVDISKVLFNNFYGYSNTTNYSKELYDRTFKGFFNTTNVYENKHIFFSYARFIGMELLESSDVNIKAGIIDELKARQLDMNVNYAKIKLPSGVEDIYTNKLDTFEEEDFINAIKLLMIASKCSEVAVDNKYAIYNKTLYSYYDYITDYLYDCIKEVVDKINNSNLFSERGYKTKQLQSFLDWLRDDRSKSGNKEKGFDVVSVNNIAEYDNINNSFMKDLFLSDTNLAKDDERYYDTTYIGWINPYITSDSKKVGLTGVFSLDVIHDGKLSRKFSTATLEDVKDDDSDEFDEDDTVTIKNESYLEPYQIYNKTIVYLENNNEYTVMMNGRFINNLEPKDCDLMCHADSIENLLTSIVPASACNQLKRGKLGTKTISQSLPVICPELKVKTGLSSNLCNKKVGKTAGSIIDEVMEINELSNKIVDNSKLIVQSVNLIDDDTTYSIGVKIDDYIFTYLHPRYIPSPTENTRLFFKLNQPKNGKYFTRNEIVILTGSYDELGEECNLMYACLDGYTYEDGVTVMSDFVNRMGLASKLYFTQKIPLDDELDTNVDLSGDTTDKNGLPLKNSFVCKGNKICTLSVKGKIKAYYAEATGYVESVEIHSSKIKITMSSIRKLTVGDKMGNGHGNKGVVVKVIDSAKLVTSNGKQPDIIINPLGTIGRMNLGQVKEMIGNNICTMKGERLTFKDIDINNKNISDLYKELEENNGYEEISIIYDNKLLSGKSYIGKIRTYRMQQYSGMHLNYTTNDRLNVNQIVDNGQKLSELATMLYSAYGCEEVLDYMMKCQSRNYKNYNALKNSIVNNTTLDVSKLIDKTPVRLNAFFNLIGYKLTSKGLSILTDSDLNNLVELSNMKNALTREEIHGKFDVNNANGYKLATKINVNNKILLPMSLNWIATKIPCRLISEDEKFKNFTPKRIESICAKEELYFCLDTDCGKFLLATEKMVLENDLCGYETGYFAFVNALSRVNIDNLLEVEKEINKRNYIELKKAIKAYSTNEIINYSILNDIPVPPINLRPQYNNNSGQSLDYYYNSLLAMQSSANVYRLLLEMSEDIKARIYQHDDGEATIGGVTHGAKKSEFRDNLVSRKYNLTGRGAATFDTDLEPFEISLPQEMVLNIFSKIIVEKLKNEFRVSLYAKDGYYQSVFGTSIYSERQIAEMIRNTINKMIAGLSVSEKLSKEIIETTEGILYDISCGMIREPILRKQNLVYYYPKMHKGDTIKIHPLVCPSYNLDFDGDATSVYPCLNKEVADISMRKMSLYDGIFDANSKNVWAKPVQDSLLGLYILTKGTKSNTSRIYIRDSGETRDTILLDVENGIIDLQTTITYFIDKDNYITETVGKIILLLTIRNDALIMNRDSQQLLLSKMDKALTNSTMDDFIRALLLQEEIYSDEYVDDTNLLRLFENIKLYKLHILKEINNLGYRIITDKLITLTPKMISSLGDSDSILKTISIENKKNGVTNAFEKTDTILNKFFPSDNNYIFKDIKYSDYSDTSKLVSNFIMKEIDKSEILSDIFNSKSRGKKEDFLKVFDTIGNIRYNNTSHNIKTNYGKSLGVVDTMLLCQPARKADVNVNVNLGQEGSRLRKNVLLACGNKTTDSSCHTKPITLPMVYDLYVDGIKLSDIEEIEIDDGKLLSFLQSITDVIEFKFSGPLVGNAITKLGLDSLNEKQVIFKLSDKSINLISDKYISIDGIQDFKLGSELIKLIEDNRCKDVKMLSLYNCVSSGICDKCYGRVDENIKGNTGINNIFTIGQTSFQGTLDASKSTKGDIIKENIDMLSIFTKKRMEDRARIIGEIKSIEKTSDGTYIVSGKPINKSRPIISYEVNSSDLDLEYLENGYYIPKGYIDIRDIIGSEIENTILEKVYVNLLYLFVSDINCQSLDLLLSNNTRYVSNSGEVERLSSENIDKEDCYRKWLFDSELETVQDVIVSMCLDNPSKHFINNCFFAKEYSKYSMFTNLFSLTHLNNSNSKTSNYYKNNYNKVENNKLSESVTMNTESEDKYEFERINDKINQVTSEF